MKGVNAVLATAALALALSLPSWAQEVKQLTHTVTLAGTVETIDHDKHLMNIKTADGVFNTVDVPPSVKRFDEVKVGDKVSVTYNNTVFVKLKPPGEAAADTEARPPRWGRRRDPGGTTAVESRRPRPSLPSTRPHRQSPSLVRTDGKETAGVSPIRMCSISSRLATRSTSPGTQASQLRWTDLMVKTVLAA